MKAGVVAYAFGAPCTIRSNRLIAKVAGDKAEKLGGSPIFAQRDVCLKAGLKVEYVQEGDSPPPTLRIARAAVHWAWLNGLEQLWVVAAKPHLWRCVRDTQKALKEVGLQIELLVCEEIERIFEEWYCSDSEQKRTQTHKDWRLREGILTALPFWLSKLVAR